MRHAEQARQLLLQGGDLGPHDEALAVADPHHGSENLVAERPVLRVEIEERNLHAELLNHKDHNA